MINGDISISTLDDAVNSFHTGVFVAYTLCRSLGDFHRFQACVLRTAPITEQHIPFLLQS